MMKTFPTLFVLFFSPSFFAWCNNGDCINGYAVYESVSGNKYVGEWKDDERNGQGTYTWASGDKYVGEFKNDGRSELGTETSANGDVKKGIWENHKLVEDN